jgi:hypothetical protein
MVHHHIDLPPGAGHRKLVATCIGIEWKLIGLAFRIHNRASNQRVSQSNEGRRQALRSWLDTDQASREVGNFEAAEPRFECQNNFRTLSDTRVANICAKTKIDERAA